jgi:hypothetical protein
VYVHLKGEKLYTHKLTGKFNRDDFHNNPGNYQCTFKQYTSQTDILMNGIYWDANIPRLFDWQDITDPSFTIQTIADITDDHNGSVPCNIGDATMEDPVYGVNRQTHRRTAPYLPGSIDLMAVNNLPNELPRDASRYFGEQLIKFVLEDLVTMGSPIIERATMVKNGKLTDNFTYLETYARHDKFHDQQGRPIN